MRALQALFALLFAAIAAYTLTVIATYGMDLSIFFVDMAELTWRGQFNLDFLTYLLLSALWVAWRHAFSPAGIALGLVASVGGMFFLAAYLLVVSTQANGDMRVLLLGPSRVEA